MSKAIGCRLKAVGQSKKGCLTSAFAARGIQRALSACGRSDSGLLSDVLEPTTYSLQPTASQCGAQP